MPQALDRQLALLAAIAGAKKALSQDELFKRLPNSCGQDQRASARKAFARDLEALQSLGAPIC